MPLEHAGAQTCAHVMANSNSAQRFDSMLRLDLAMRTLRAAAAPPDAAMPPCPRLAWRRDVGCESGCWRFIRRAMPETW